MKKLYKDSKTFVDKPVKLPRSEVNQNFLKLIPVSCKPLNTEAIKGLSWKSLLFYPLMLWYHCDQIGKFLKGLGNQFPE